MFFVALLLTSCSAGKNQENSESQLNISEIEPEVDALVKQYQDLDIFSGAVLIAEHGKPVYHKAFGLADREKNIKNTLQTKFDIGSMNKTFTKVVILQLIEEGKLKLDDQLSDLLPTFSHELYSKITVDHLINHSSGFGDYHMSEGFFELPVEEKDIESLVERIRKMPLLFEAGTEREYSNSGYILLGAIIEKITGTSYHQNVQDRIVTPLGLNDTYVTDKYNVPDRAIGYFKTMRGELQDNMGFIEVPNPDGGFQSTALDVMNFYREFHYGNKLLKEETKMKDELFRMTREHLNTGGAIPHAGGFEGANTVNYEILRDDITITVLANMDEPVAEQLGLGILTIIRGQEPIEPSLPAIQNVYLAYTEKGIDHVHQNFERLTVNFHPTDPKSLILNQIGYEFLFNDQLEKAIEIFTLNTELFGNEDPNVWDSLGEAYLAKGDKENAVKYYKKALSMDPEMQSAIEALDKIKKSGF